MTRDYISIGAFTVFLEHAVAGNAMVNTCALEDEVTGLFDFEVIFDSDWFINLKRYTVDFEVFGEKARNPAAAEIDFLVAVE